MAKQETLGLYGKGICKTKAGHLRYHSPRSMRGQYVHRKIIEDLVAETPWSVRLLLPLLYEVHHQDYNKEHNCAGNLLIVSEQFHSCMTADRPRRMDGRFGWRPKWKPPAEDIIGALLEGIDEVPF